MTINELCSQLSELDEKLKKSNKMNSNHSSNEDSDTIFVEHSDALKCLICIRY